MSTSEIKQRLEAINESVGDDEIAHGMEDALRADFLKYVASLKTPIGEKAQLVLSTDKLKFSRWCA